MLRAGGRRPQGFDRRSRRGTFGRLFQRGPAVRREEGGNGQRDGGPREAVRVRRDEAGGDERDLAADDEEGRQEEQQPVGLEPRRPDDHERAHPDAGASGRQEGERRDRREHDERSEARQQPPQPAPAELPGWVRRAPELVNPGGAVEVSVRYNNRGGWPAAADGTGHSLIMTHPDFEDASKTGSWNYSPLAGGSPGLLNLGEQLFDVKTLIASGEAWKYFKGLQEPSDPKELWRQPGFVDGGWETGLSPIGYGDPIYTGTVLDDMISQYGSLYLRKTFEVGSLEGMDVLALKICADDGFIAYLNGQEVAKSNVNNGDAFNALASASSDCPRYENELNITSKKDLLVSGANTLAIQVHNQTLASNDFGATVELLSKRAYVVGGAPKIDVDLNELLSNTQGERWLEIFNDEESEVDLSGYFLTNEAANLRKFQLSAGTKVPSKGFLVRTEAELKAQNPTLALVPPNGDDSVFLILSRPEPGQPAGTPLTQVVDARYFRVPDQAELSNIRYPDGKSNWAIARQPTRDAANQFEAEKNIVINEIMFHPYYPAVNFPTDQRFFRPEDQGEYLELYNRGDRPVSLKGWNFTSGVEYRFPDSTVMPPGGYLVVARDPEWLVQHYGLPAEQVLGPWYNERYDNNGQPIQDAAVLADSGEEVVLSDEIGNPVNQVRYWDGGDYPRWADGRGSSLELIDPFQDNAIPWAWDASDDSGKSEWKHYSYKARYIETGEKALWLLLLTEGIVHVDNIKVYDPANPDINFVANGTFDVDTKGWLIDGTQINSGRIVYDKKDGDGCLRIVATGRGNDRLDRLKTNLAAAMPQNKDLMVELDARWIAGEGVLHLGGVWNTMAGHFFAEIPAKLGTPGKENSVRARLANKNQGPLIHRVKHEPALPAAGQDVIVRAEVSDSDGVKEVQLVYSIDAAGGAKTVLAMKDDGQSGDRKAGDGVYGATIPGQALNARVVFSIVAADNLGNTNRFPEDKRQRTHPFLLDPANTPEIQLRYCIYQHGDFKPNGVPDYRMLLNKEGYTYLTTRRVMNNDLIDAGFVWNDSEVWYNARIRYGNSPWTRAGRANITSTSYVVKLPREKEIGGLKKFKLDERGAQINERVEYHLLRANNIPGRGVPVIFGRSAYVNGYLNNTSFGPVFERVETPGKQFISRWFPSDDEGVLFKLDDKFRVDGDGKRTDNRDAYIRYPADKSNGPDGENPENYRWYFFHRTRDKYDDFSELIDLARFFSKSTASDYNQQLFDEVNLESIVRTLAVEINVDDWDTWGTARGKNCYFYRPRIDQRWVLIGWDKDLTFGSPSNPDTILVPTKFPETVRLLNSPPGKKVYHSVMNDMLKTFYTAEYVNTFFSQQGVDKDGKKNTRIPQGASGPASFLNSRRNTMRGVLPRTPVPFQVTSGQDGLLVVSQPEVAFEGSAPLEVWSILMTYGDKGDDFQVGEITWNTNVAWKLPPLSVPSGVTDFVFIASDNRGDIIGSDTLQVAYTSGWKPPALASLEPKEGPAGGSMRVIITGTDFQKLARVFFGDSRGTVDEVRPDGALIAVFTPAHDEGTVDVKVENVDGQSAILAGAFSFIPGGNKFVRGDADFNKAVNMTDAIVLLLHLFQGGSLACEKAADADDNGELEIADAIFILKYQFLGGSLPPPPFDPEAAVPGFDPTGDALTCKQGAN